MNREKHPDNFSEGLIVGILIGHYVKPYDAPLWMKIIFWIIVVGVLILWIYLWRDGRKYKKKPE